MSLSVSRLCVLFVCLWAFTEAGPSSSLFLKRYRRTVSSDLLHKVVDRLCSLFFFAFWYLFFFFLFFLLESSSREHQRVSIHTEEGSLRCARQSQVFSGFHLTLSFRTRTLSYFIFLFLLISSFSDISSTTPISRRTAQSSSCSAKRSAAPFSPSLSLSPFGLSLSHLSFTGSVFSR
jgi:hypothetical protein